MWFVVVWGGLMAVWGDLEMVWGGLVVFWGVTMDRYQSFVCNFLSTLRCKSQIPAKETKCLSCFGRNF